MVLPKIPPSTPTSGYLNELDGQVVGGVFRRGQFSLGVTVNWRPQVPTIRAGTVYFTIPHGSEYSVNLWNGTGLRADATLRIDGDKQGTFRLNPGVQYQIERPASDARKFTFLSTTSALANTIGIKAGEPQNGLLEVTFQPEASPPTAPAAPVHGWITCDGCGMMPLVGIRYRCQTCINLDLCENCMQTMGHAPTHHMQRLVEPTDWVGRTIFSMGPASTFGGVAATPALGCLPTPPVPKMVEMTNASGEGATALGAESMQSFSTVKPFDSYGTPVVIRAKMVLPETEPFMNCWNY